MEKKLKVVVLSGAGMSAESGIPTFRDMGGLWEKYDITEVASPEGWEKNPELVLKFYSERIKKLHEVKPNKGHIALAEAEKDFDISIVTQNVDDLHERAGSSKVVHLHGELKKVRSTGTGKVYDIQCAEIKSGDMCPDGFQLRPHIVWFGESVHNMTESQGLIQNADVLIIVGTSLQVYPAAGLHQHAKLNCKKYYIDPAGEIGMGRFEVIKDTACNGIPRLLKKLSGINIHTDA